MEEHFTRLITVPIWLPMCAAAISALVGWFLGASFSRRVSYVKEKK